MCCSSSSRCVLPGSLLRWSSSETTASSTPDVAWESPRAAAVAALLSSAASDAAIMRSTKPSAFEDRWGDAPAPSHNRKSFEVSHPQSPTPPDPRPSGACLSEPFLPLLAFEPLPFPLAFAPEVRRAFLTGDAVNSLLTSDFRTTKTLRGAISDVQVCRATMGAKCLRVGVDVCCWCSSHSCNSLNYWHGDPGVA